MMITGSKVRIVKCYLPIDRLAEGLLFVYPENGEVFEGFSYGYYAEDAMPFINVVKDGYITKSINATDLSEIEFETEVRG